MEDLENDPDYVSRRAKAEQEYRLWLDRNYAGTMDWLYRQADLKFRPDRVMAGAKSMLVAILPYGQRQFQKAVRDDSGRISIYASGRDYHKVFGNALRTSIEEFSKDTFGTKAFRTLVDANPLQERFFAEEAGLGFTGRHTLIITPRFGSWVFLGCVLSTVRAEEWGLAFSDLDSARFRERCPSACFKCLDVCPTKALFAAGKMDARRCISYLTIEHKGRINEELRPLMGDWVYGCDLCQEVCPFNAASQPTAEKDFLVVRAGRDIPLSELLEIRSHEDMTRRFSGTPIMRAGWESMLRNACIAAGNSGNHEFITTLRELGLSPSEIVREHALWALDRITKSSI